MFRVVSVVENTSEDEISFTLTCVQHNPDIFSAVDNGTVIQVPPISALRPKAVAAPTNVTLASTETAGQVMAATTLDISWDAVDGAAGYFVSYRKDSGNWHSLGKHYGLSAGISYAIAGTYEAAVVAFNAAGDTSLSAISNAYIVADQTAKPGFVADLSNDIQAAQEAADTANATLANIASDGLLTPVEKPTVIRDHTVITSEQAGIDAQADAYSITTAKTSYDSSVSELNIYLAGLTAPVGWDDLTGDTTIDGPTFRSKFATVYEKRQALLNAIYAAAKQAAADAEASAKAYTDSELTAYVEATVYDSKIADLQSQIDGAINSYFYDYDAATTNAPANGWTTVAEKDAHLGDTFTNGWDGSSAGGSGTPGASWRWALSGSTYYWQVISDTATQKALALAAAAQDTADHKRRNFTTQPTTPYDVGDTWTQDGVVYACTTAKTASGSFAQSDWTKAGDITSQNQSASTATIGDHTQDDLPSGINYGRVALPYLDGTGRITNFYDWRAAQLRQFDSLAGKQTASFTGGDVSDIPTPISDGRVGLAIDLSGKIKTGWYTARKIAGVDFDGTADIDVPLSGLTGRTADHISYTGGDTVDSLKPAQAGADATAGKSLTVLTDRTLSNIADDATYRRVGATYVDDSNRPTALYYNGIRTGDYFLARANQTGTQPADTVDETATRKWAGESGATVGANWATNLAGRPLELTDGRIGIGLDASGNLASKFATPRKIAGVAFDASADIDLGPSNVGALPVGGTATAASRLATARKIAGINFDGAADITIPRANLTGTIDNVPDGTNYRRAGAGYVDPSGRLTAVWDGTTIRQGTDIGTAVSRANTGLDANGYLRTRFATPRTIAGVNFDGSADIAIPSTGLSDGTALARGGDSITRFGGRTLDNIGETASFKHYSATDKTKLAGVEDGATVGADWANNLANRPQNIGPNLADHATFFNGIGQWINEQGNADGIAANVGSTDGYLQCNVTAGNVSSGNQNFYEGVWQPTQPGVVFYVAVDLSAYGSIHDVQFGLNFTNDSHDSYQWLPCGVTAAGIGATHQVALITTPAGATQVRLWAAVIGGAIGDAVRFGHVQWAREALMTPGSYARLGDLRNQVAVGYANFGAGWSGGNISYTASSDGTATINVSSATLQAGSIALTYSASSTSVSGGMAGGSSVYYLYYDDPDSSGGAKTLHATTSQITSLASDGRRLVGQITVTFPSSGSGSGGGGLGCITPEAYVMIHRASETRIITAGELQKTYRTGDYIRAVDPATGLEWWQQIDSVQLGVANGVTVTTTNGCQLTCTDIAWLGQPDGSRIRAKDTQGQSLYTRAGASEASMTSAGTIDIVKIMSGGVFFLASSDGQNWLAHHNMKPSNPV